MASIQPFMLERLPIDWSCIDEEAAALFADGMEATRAQQMEEIKGVLKSAHGIKDESSTAPSSPTAGDDAGRGLPKLIRQLSLHGAA
jgi:hypothetical protein